MNVHVLKSKFFRFLRFLLSAGVRTQCRPAALVFFFTVICGLSIAVAQKNIDISRKNAPVEEILQQVKSTSNYRFVYESSAIKGLKNVDIQLKGASINQVMDACLEGSNLTYVVEGNTVIIRAKANITTTVVIQGSKKLTGTVRGSEKNTPIAGVTVTMMGNNMATIVAATDQNGAFSITYPQNSSNTSLQFSIVGKKPVKLAVGDKSQFQVAMEDVVEELDDIVVTGIFNKAKETYTGAAKEISALELKQFQGRNLFVTLGNIDPAFYVVPNNLKGSDPNVIPDIQLRGTSSLPNINQLQDATSSNLNMPLVVIDGFETTIRRMMDLDVNEVESITLLKDGSATALYGSRGANGVVVIKTKTPAAGKLSVYYRAALNVNVPDLSSYNLLNAKDKLELERLSGYYQNSTKSPEHNLQMLDYYNQVYKLVDAGINTNWLAKPLRLGMDQNHNLRVEGGDNSFRYSIGASYNDVQGVMKGSDRKTFNGSINISYDYQKFTFRNNTIIGNTKTFESPYGSFSDYAKLNPYWSPYDSKGNIARVFEPFAAVYWDQNGIQKPIPNPLYDATLNVYDNSSLTNITNNLQLEWRPLQGLVMRGGIGIITENSDRDNFKPADHSSFNDYTPSEVFYKGSYKFDSGKTFSYTGNFTTNYFRTFAQKHSLYIGVNVDVSERNARGFSFLAEGFPGNNVDFLPLAYRYKRNDKPQGNEETLRRVGLVSTLNYSLSNTYILDLSYRLDGASQFGSNRKFAPFWSIGTAWNVHKERFIRDNLSFVNNFKIRASYGMTGTTQFSAYQSQSIFNYYFDQRYGPWIGAYQSKLGNPDLKWQSTDQYNLGTDIELFNSRFSIRADVYRKITTNLLSSLELPFSNGFTDYTENVGSLREQGFELSSSFKIIPTSNRKWGWSITANVAHNQDRITKLSQAMKEANERQFSSDVAKSGNPPRVLVEGASQNTIYAVRSLGIDPSNGKELFLGKDGKITYNGLLTDQVAVGMNQPKYRGNFSTLVRYKDFTLNASFGFRFGGQLYNATLLDKVERANKFFNVDSRVFTDRWQKPGDVAKFKGLNEDGYSLATTRFVQNESAFFLQNVNANYNFVNQAWLKNARIRTLSIGASTGELFYLSSVPQERGTGYPFSRQVSLNLSVMF
ncbi:SusC/RagA family TonB-linked outer membrane protein [Sphingobacterium sp. Mn56C]|uniref:SusC/RagA family TonB-linked outer membrane protein n=1 Tax=Sphingobacterium sp. Mn56C TaxID=3395261 RepID=UPI003BD29E4E